MPATGATRGNLRGFWGRGGRFGRGGGIARRGPAVGLTSGGVGPGDRRESRDNWPIMARYTAIERAPAAVDSRPIRRSAPVHLEFVGRPPRGAGPSPGSGRPNGHCSARHGPPCVRQRRSPACGPSTTRGCVHRWRRPDATQRCLDPGLSERIGNSRRTGGVGRPHPSRMNEVARTADAEHPARDVNRVVWRPLSVYMRMVRQPRTSCASTGHIGTNRNDLEHLKPAEQPMHRRRVPHVPPSAPCDLLGRSEPAEEQKEITGADTFSRQVTLRDVHLSECWSPSRSTRKCSHLKIRVEMTARIAPDAASGQVFNEGSERAVAPPNVSKLRRTAARGNGQGHDSAIRQDRARNPAVAGVESLAAQHDLHGGGARATVERAV